NTRFVRYPLIDTFSSSRSVQLPRNSTPAADELPPLYPSCTNAMSVIARWLLGVMPATNPEIPREVPVLIVARAVPPYTPIRIGSAAERPPLVHDGNTSFHVSPLLSSSQSGDPSRTSDAPAAIVR